MKCEITLEEYGNVKFSELPNTIHNAIIRQLKKSFDWIWDRVSGIFEKAKLCEIAEYTDVFQYIEIV